MVFLDQSQAFDRIWHAGLLSKMKSCGINLLALIENYLHNRQIRVVINGSESNWCQVTAGVPQGSILGPLLFLICINDITMSLESETHLYADDAVLTLSAQLATAVDMYRERGWRLQSTFTV